MRIRFPLLAGFIFILIVSAQLAYSQSPATTLFLPGDDILGPAAFDQTEPAISVGGNQSLTAWTDYRTGGSHLVIAESGADIFAARLDAAGNLLDTTPILLTMAAGDDTDPKIAWNGQNWLVIWLAQAPTEFFWATEVRAVRVSPSGQVLDPEPIALLQFSSSGSAEAEVASDGTNWVVVMRGTSAGETDILAARIAPDGTVLDPGGVSLVPGNFSLTFQLDVAFLTDEYLLTYLHMGAVKGLRFQTDLDPIDPNPFTIASPADEAQRPRVASNGAGFFVVWGEYNGGTQWGQAKGTRVNHAGQVLDPSGLAISGLVSLGVDDVRIAWDGTNWVAIYKLANFGSDPDILSASRITTAGQVLDVGGENIEPVTTGYFATQIEPAPGGGSRIVWQDNRAGGTSPNDISTFSLSTTLQPGEPDTISFGAPAQVEPDAAYAGSGAMIVYLSRVSGNTRVMAHPLGSNGLPILDEPLLLDSGPNLASPAVAWNGSVHLVVWSQVGSPSLNDSVAWGQRINPDGTLADPAPVALMEGFGTDVAAAGEDFLVVAIQQTTTSEVREPFGIRVDGATGAVIGSPIDLGGSFTRHVSVGGLDGRWLVAYQRNFSHDDSNAEIDAVFVEANGNLSSGILVAGGLNPFFYRPDVASDGTDSIVVWENANPPANHNILGARILGNGTVGPIINVNNLSEPQNTAAVAWDGAQYVVLYQDLRNRNFFLDDRSDVFGTLLNASGGVIDPQGFAVYDSVYPEISPAVSSASGISLMAASLFRAETGFMVYRVGYSLLGDQLPTPTPTNTPPTTPTGTPPTPTNTPTATPTGTPPTPTATPTQPVPPAFWIYLPVILRSP